MAFTDEPARAILEWESTGLQVSCFTSTLAARIAVERFAARGAAGKKVRDKDIGRLAAVFVAHVERWNIRRETGSLVPLTAEGVLSLDKHGTLLPMLTQWMTLVSQPPAVADETPAEPELAPAEDVALPDPDEEFMAALEARTLTEPGEGEQLVTEPSAEPAQVLEPV
jgi:hypothetical protein